MTSDESSSAPEVAHPLREKIERLLYEDESNVLDFKAEQYAFGQGTDEQRGEVLKDILAMANSWGRADTRYILIGVRENVGGRAEVVGVSQHLPEHALQQMVNGRTNRPLELSYHAVDMGGQSVGAIVIPRQQRPTFLKKVYGRLEAHTVYVRRGSSTAVADPDEIAEMGAANQERAAARSAELRIEMGFPEHRTTYGVDGPLTVESVAIPSSSSLPDYRERQSLYSTGIFFNRDYFRDVARWVWASRATLPLGFYVQNVGSGAASNVTIRMEVEIGADYTVLGQPVQEPSRYFTPTNVLVEQAEEQKKPYRAKLRDGLVREIRFDLGPVQPGFALWTDPFYLVVEKPGELKLNVEIYCDQLAVPQKHEFVLHAEGNLVNLDAAAIIRIAEDMLDRKNVR